MHPIRGLRQLAERTPPSRDRYIDLLRALAIVAVVLGHWLVSVVGYDEGGRLTARSALPDLRWAQPLTWVVQVMPVFFFVGGYANAASLAAHRERGGDAVGWLLNRGGRIVRPTTALVLVLAAGALAARLLGADPARVRTAVWFASIPLWFLSVYLFVVVLTPVMYALHRRFGLAVPVVLVALVALGDLARLRGAGALGYGNYVFGWLAIHQIGLLWRDGRLPARPRVALPLLLGGLTTALLLTVLGPYPISMINVPGERLHNMSPPSLALLAIAAAQLGLALLLRDRAERWLQRARPWMVVVAVNAVVLTTFLWHITAAVLLAAALHALHLLPTPRIGSGAWLLWRVPWLVMLALVLAVLVAIFGPIEARATRPAARPNRLPAGLSRALTRPAPRLLLTLAGFAAVVLGLLANSLTPKLEPALFGLPTTALVAYLSGAAVLRLLRAIPDERPAETG
jgi:peptidoglycan/LPS O-acetylase OafA/YrhL